MVGCSLSRFSTCVTLARVSPWRRARADWFTPPASSWRRNSSARASVFWIGAGCHTLSRDFSRFLASWKSITTSVTILPLQAPLGSHGGPLVARSILRPLREAGACDAGRGPVRGRCHAVPRCPPTWRWWLRTRSLRSPCVACAPRRPGSWLRSPPPTRRAVRRKPFCYSLVRQHLESFLAYARVPFGWNPGSVRHMSTGAGEHFEESGNERQPGRWEPGFPHPHRRSSTSAASAWMSEATSESQAAALFDIRAAMPRPRRLDGLRSSPERRRVREAPVLRGGRGIAPRRRAAVRPALRATTPGETPPR